MLHLSPFVCVVERERERERGTSVAFSETREKIEREARERERERERTETQRHKRRMYGEKLKLDLQNPCILDTHTLDSVLTCTFSVSSSTADTAPFRGMHCSIGAIFEYKSQL